MNLKESIQLLQEDYLLSYKEARFKLKSHLRKMYEDGEIDKATWKEAKRILKEELK